MKSSSERIPNGAIFFSLLWLGIGLTACIQPEIPDHTSPSRNERPAWTPDGKRIAFSSNRNGNYELYVMNKDGSEQINLTQTATAELFPAVSSKGDEIAFVGEVDGNYDIYVVNVDGSNRRRLTHEARIDDWPSWGSNDQVIVYDYVDDGDYGIVQMDTNGSNKHILVDNSARTVDPHTVNSSHWIVYSSDELDPGGNDAIFSYHDISGATERLTELDIDAGAPALSHDGKKIVFNAGDSNWDLYVMNRDGSDIKRLTANAGDNKWGAFSPDGSEIAFTSSRNGGWHIFLMKADGSDVRQLTY